MMRNRNILIAVVLFATIIQHVQAITFKGVVSDAVNGLKVREVKVSTGGVSTYTDEYGNFYLDSPGTTGNDYLLTFYKDETEVTMDIPADQVGNIDARIKFKYPLRNIYHLFEEYPERLGFGPEEPRQANTQCKGFIPDNSTVEATHPCYKLPDYIGGQLKRHNMMFIGEKYRVIKLVKDGQIMWKYNTKNEPENNDVWVLSNGNVLYAHQWYIQEVTPDKRVVWTINMPCKTYKECPEVHSCQAIGQDSVVFLVNYPEGCRIETYNKKTREHTKSPLLEGYYKLNDPHGQGRRLRVKANRNYLVATMNGNYFHEYDKDFNLLHSFTSDAMNGMWGGMPLKNGNYILQREGKRTTVEVDRNGNAVWQVSLDELLPQMVNFGLPQSVADELVNDNSKIAKTQMCARLANGNTVMFIRGCRSNRPQCVEVTPDKKVVWILQDRYSLGDGLHAHFLEQPGYPEIPGDIEH